MNVCTPTLSGATCCFTGHRKIDPDVKAALTEQVNALIGELYGLGIRTFRCGGAVGFDTLAAVEVIRRRMLDAPEARLVLVLPCRDQAAKWSHTDRALYEQILARANEVVYVADTYSRENMLLRDRALVDGCGICVAYLNGTRGGTAYTVRYAEKSHIRVINLGDAATQEVII